MSQKLFELEEPTARTRWRAGAARIHHGLCNSCGRTHDSDGRPLIVARQRHSKRGFECFDCFASRR